MPKKNETRILVVDDEPDVLELVVFHLEKENFKVAVADTGDKALKMARGVDGKVEFCRYARENKKPVLGICLGFQSMTIEAARNLCGWENANSAEFDEETPHPVVIFMPEVSKTHMGGTMRLGKRRTILQPDCLSAKLYGDVTEVDERHRHRYEVNIDKVGLSIQLLQTSSCVAIHL